MGQLIKNAMGQYIGTVLLQQEKFLLSDAKQKARGCGECGGSKQEPTTKVDADTILGGIQGAGGSAMVVIELKIAS